MCWLLLFAWQPAPASVSAAQRDTTRSPHGPLAIPCENCHTYTSWKPIRAIPEFDHNKTRYPLRGMHDKVACTQCHVKPVFTDVGKNCADCHADIHRRKFGPNCEQCHTVSGWQVSVQQVKEHQNRFPLIGAHLAVECEACHKGAAVGQYQGLSTNCSSCHLKDFQKTTSPSHAGANFPTTCNSCHSMDSWAGAKFDHLQVTGYALTGVHATLDCLACHIGGRYKGTPAACIGCHQKDFNTTNNPPHAQAGFSTTCQMCHSTSSWLNATFNHSLTKFPLTGRHIGVPCTQCHINNVFAGTPTGCGAAGCHLTTWQQTNNPVHATSGPVFAASNCVNCHTTGGWDAANFNHSMFPLTNAHAGLQCTQCHINNNYNLTSTACSTCHMDKFNTATSPVNHIKSGFDPAICATCHDTIAWIDGKFNHTTMTTFPLTGLHIGVACSACHSSGVYKGLTTSCGAAGCHLTTWQQTNNPVHAAAGPDFAAANCTNCHTTAGWTSATFNHTRFFPLTNAHAGLQCAQCHLAGRLYSAAPTTCQGCHMDKYNTALTPINHVQVGFPPTLCSTCHDTIAWVDGKFNHNTTIFPLTGMHVSVPCAQCHIKNNYLTVPTDCYSCHVAAWNSTTTLGGGVPNHITAGFPTTCATCHTTSSWLGAVFNHTYFVIPHHGSVCSDCHLVPSNYATFSCINCHTQSAHSKADTDSRHQGVGGYSYGPTTCYNCHKGGGG